MIGGAKGIGIGIDFGLPNLYRKPSGKSYIEPDVLASLRVVTMAYGKKNSDSDRAIIKNLVDPDNPFIISNAAYKLNSGFGLYQLDFDSLDRTDQSELTTDYKSVTISKIIKESDGNVIYNWSKNLPALDSVRIQVKGLDEIGARLVFIYLNDSGQNVRTTYHSDGIYTLPSSSAHAGNSYTTNFRLAIFGYTGDCNVTITQIPQYEGAFVTDGIDDLITSTKTVQEMLGESNEITVVSMIHQVKDSANNVSFTNYIRGSANGYFRNIVNNYDKTGIYGYTSSDLKALSVVNNILGDKNDYTSNGDNRDSIINGNFSVQGYSYNDGNNTGDFSSVAWYWTIIANKVLTTDQINQVIAYFNLDRCVKPDVLYDIKKQGITNENHAEFNDKLIDFSGNGRDMQLNNIAWDGDSGIGKYNYPGWKLTANKAGKYRNIRIYQTLNGTYTAKFEGVTELYNRVGIGLEILSKNIYVQIKEDGIYSVDPVENATELQVRFGDYVNTELYDCDITITQIPSNVGALRLDGVEDYGKVVGMPIYKDYTIIVERETDKGKIFSNPMIVASKSRGGINGGAFIFEYINSQTQNLPVSSVNAWSFYNGNAIGEYNRNKFISYQTKYKYNNSDISIGETTDSDTLWLGTIRDNDIRFFNGAIYSLMSFPYSMSTFLIERQLKKNKLGTLYPDMVEFRPIIKANANYKILSTALLPLTGDTWEEIKVGDYVDVGRRVAIQVSFDNDASELVSAISSKLDNVSIAKNSNGEGYFIFGDILKSKSPQNINITIDEYIRYEDIVQPYPSLFTLTDYDTKETYSWGSKLKVGAKFTGKVINLLPDMYQWDGDVLYNGKTLNWGINPGIVAKEMIFSWSKPFKYLFDNNAPKCILSPSRLRIPNSSYKILGYIPDISGHGNHGKINNSAYAEGSGVNADGSYQLDGVDDFITIPTLSSGGKQVLMKVNWQNDYDIPGYMYDTNIVEYRNYIIKGNKEQIAYENASKTYIDGILNANLTSGDLKGITHNITSQFNGISSTTYIGCRYSLENFLKMSLYDFMLFDEISTDEEIATLNEYIGIEPKVTVPPYYWDAYGKANNNADDIEGTRHALWNKANLTDAGEALICNNIGYDEMSGYGGYSFKSFDTVSRWNVYPSSGEVAAIEIISRNGYSITLKKKLEDIYSWQFNYGSTVTNLSEDLKFNVKCDKPIKVIWQFKYRLVAGESYRTETISTDDLTANVEANLTLLHKTPAQLEEMGVIQHYYLIYFNNAKLAIDEEYTITMLPLYPNGLCLDGVDDYLFNANIPALTDFTVIAKREWFNKSKYLNECFAHKGIISTPIRETAFMLEYEIGNDTYYRSSSYGGYINVERSNRPEKIVYQTPTSYNGSSITIGSGIDTTGLTIGAVTNNYWKGVFYKAILYPKTITNLEIMFLKNMFEKDEIIDLTNPIFIQE